VLGGRRETSKETAMERALGSDRSGREYLVGGKQTEELGGHYGEECLVVDSADRTKRK